MWVQLILQRTPTVIECLKHSVFVFAASPAPVYKCEKYTTSCGDKECEWDEKCISAKSCGKGRVFGSRVNKRGF